MDTPNKRCQWRKLGAVLLVLSLTIVFLLPAVSTADMTADPSADGDHTEQVTDTNDPITESEADQENSEIVPDPEEDSLDDPPAAEE